MNDPAEMIRVALLALVVGVGLPLLVQLFLTLRSLQKTFSDMKDRMDPALRDLSAAVAGLRRMTEPNASSQAASLLGAAAVPAVLAALNAFRAHMEGDGGAPPETASAPATTQPTPQGP